MGQKILCGPKKIWVKKIFGSKKIFGQKNNLGENNFWVKKFWGQHGVRVKKKLVN